MSKVDEIAIYIRNNLTEQFNEGKLGVDIRAGDLWKLLQIKLGLTGITQVCGAMRMVASEMPSRWLSNQSIKNSTTVLYRYYKNATTALEDDQLQGELFLSHKIVSDGEKRRVDIGRQAATVAVKKITEDELTEATNRVSGDLRYGAQGRIIKDCFLQYPHNTDDNIITMKIALIDMTNSTNLNKHLGKVMLTDLVTKIKACNFDERVAAGDPSLVSELANSGVTNLFSFFSKYCIYHNYYVYKRDDYVIYDGVVRDHIGEYIYEYCYNGKIYKSKGIKGLIQKMRQAYDYAGYKALVDTVLESNNIQCPYKRRKLDWFIWYNNRTSKREDDE